MRLGCYNPRMNTSEVTPKGNRVKRPVPVRRAGRMQIRIAESTDARLTRLSQEVGLAKGELAAQLVSIGAYRMEKELGLHDAVAATIRDAFETVVDGPAD